MDKQKTYYKKQLSSDSEGSVNDGRKLVNDLNQHTLEEETKNDQRVNAQDDLRAEIIKLEHLLPKNSV